MANTRPTTIAGYIRAAPHEAQAHLRVLYAILRSVAPNAKETIKWGTPFFVEPRFLFAFAAHREHLSFAPMAAGLEPFRKRLGKHDSTKNTLKIPYGGPFPTVLVRKIAARCVREVARRKSDGFWS